MSCLACGASQVRLVSSRLNAAGDRLKRFECRVCLHRWGSRNGTLESHYDPWKEIDWRVPAGDGCRDCVHYAKGFCSLGFPEAKDPAFVTECEARSVQGGVFVVQ
jgi:hypothetical protein